MKNVLEIIGWAILAGSVLAAMMFIRLDNPGLTETELFLRFWWVYTPIAASAIIAATVARCRK